MNELSDLTLTEDEVAVILEMRAQAAAKKRRDLLTVHMLQVASEFESWRQKNGVGCSFSTFCDDFGYPGVGDLFLGVDWTASRSLVYKAIVDLIAVAKNNS